MAFLVESGAKGPGGSFEGIAGVTEDGAGGPMGGGLCAHCVQDPSGISAWGTWGTHRAAEAIGGPKGSSKHDGVDDVVEELERPGLAPGHDGQVFRGSGEELAAGVVPVADCTGGFAGGYCSYAGCGATIRRSSSS